MVIQLSIDNVFQGVVLPDIFWRFSTQAGIYVISAYELSEDTRRQTSVSEYFVAKLEGSKKI